MKTKTPKAVLPAQLIWPILVLLVLLYLCVSLAAAAVPREQVRRRMRVRNASFFARIALRLFHVRAHHRARFASARTKGCLVVANHVSYIDVLALAALMPAVFITSVELRNTALLGLVARSAGCLFVERRKPSGLKREIEAIAAVLDKGFPVVLFPEATTSNGDRVHPFKRSLFDAAVASGSDILPVCLRYTSINGEPVSAANRDSLFFYGGVTFSRHFPKFLALRSVDLEISLLPALNVLTRSRKDLAAEAHDSISKAYHGHQESKST